MSTCSTCGGPLQVHLCGCARSMLPTTAHVLLAMTKPKTKCNLFQSLLCCCTTTSQENTSPCNTTQVTMKRHAFKKPKRRIATSPHAQSKLVQCCATCVWGVVGVGVCGGPRTKSVLCLCQKEKEKDGTRKDEDSDPQHHASKANNTHRKHMQQHDKAAGTERKRKQLSCYFFFFFCDSTT